MATQPEDFHSIRQESFTQLSTKELRAQQFEQRFKNKNSNNNNKLLRLQVSKPPRNAVKLKPIVIPVHLTWAIVLTIIAFFLIGPCWALYKTIQLRRMIKRQEAEAALRLSHKITTVLVVCTALAAFIYVAILFCSVGLVLTGKLLDSDAI